MLGRPIIHPHPNRLTTGLLAALFATLAGNLCSRSTTTTQGDGKTSNNSRANCPLYAHIMYLAYVDIYRES